MKKIELLSEHLIDQIKAGEVIEKPAQVLKELVENSLDAGATQIQITLSNNGLDLLQVEDNGHGINHLEVPFAFARHTTCLLYTSPSPRDQRGSRMPSSA